MIRKAFTLIELLVVIAIIAILAAILFPVFAQAKASAKSAASLSNAKQQTLGNIMYAGDFDDTLPLGTAWATGRDQLCYPGGPTMCFATWAWSIAPYVKNSQLYMDPQTSPNPARAANQANFDTYYIQYGYNYTYLSPLPVFAGPEVGVSATAVGSPADTVMLGAKWAQSENTSGFDWGTWFPKGQLAAAAIDSVDCNNIPNWCLSGWGHNSFYDNGGLNLAQQSYGKYTGGNSLRAAGNSITTFVDGHTKKLAPGNLAVGTTWNINANESSVVINDTSKYLWDLQ